MDQVPVLRAGIDQGLHPLGDRRGKGGQFRVGGQDGVHPWTSFPGSSTRPSRRNSRQPAGDAALWCQTTGVSGPAGTR